MRGSVVATSYGFIHSTRLCGFEPCELKQEKYRILHEVITSELMNYESRAGVVRCGPKTVAVAVVIFFPALDMSSKQVTYTIMHQPVRWSQDRALRPFGALACVTACFS